MIQYKGRHQRLNLQNDASSLQSPASSPTLAPAFACPIHKVLLEPGLRCRLCNQGYRSVNGIPILLNEANSLFRAADYESQDQAYGGASSYAGHLDHRSGLRQFYRHAVHWLAERSPPAIDFNVHQAIDEILKANPSAQILVIGSGDASIKGDVTYTDVSFGAHVQCIADAHDLPFPAGSFDACVASAVLEHVVDPVRCVDEITRVLRPGGFVYAETPFMQPVHMREYDFTRFTYLGHRRLFRCFDDVRSGIAGGPGTSAGHAIRYAIASLSDRPTLRKWLRLLGLLITYPARWLDYVACKHASAYDSASAFYFFGTLRPEPIPDRELLQLFRGS